MPMTVTSGEMLVRLAIAFDKRGMQEAQTAIGKVDAAIKSFGKGLLGITTALAGARLFGEFVSRASDANETMNVLNETMGEHVDDIVDWSKNLAKGVGRSEFSLRQYAGEVAALVTPTLGATKAARDLSTGFAQLSVDLSSFFNTTESDALEALKAALTGQVKPMRRYGVNLIQANLDQFAFEQGINKTVKEMSEAERQMLRYNFIMRYTQNAQGDAARTAHMFANASRAAKDALIDLGTRVGFAFVGDVNKALLAIQKFAFYLADLEERSELVSKSFKALMLFIGTIMAPSIFKFLAGFALKFGPIIAAVMILFILFDEIVSFFEGDFTIIGNIIDIALGPGNAREIRNAWVETYQKMRNSALNYFNFVKGGNDDFMRGIDTLEGKIILASGNIIASLEFATNLYFDMWRWFFNWFKKMWNWFADLEVSVGGFKFKPLAGMKVDLFEYKAGPQFDKRMAQTSAAVARAGQLAKAYEEGRMVEGLTHRKVAGGKETVFSGMTKSEERLEAERINKGGGKQLNVKVDVKGDLKGKDLDKLASKVSKRIAKEFEDVREGRAEEAVVVPAYQQVLETP